MRALAKNWVLVGVLALGTVAQGQGSGKRKATQKNKDADQKTDTAPSPQKRLGEKFADAVANTQDTGDDHVPCFFTLKQLMALRPSPSVPKLTEADESSVITAIAKAVDSDSGKELTSDKKAKFIAILSNDLDGKLVGKTPGEALATIMNILYSLTAKNSDLVEDIQASKKEAVLEKTVAKAKMYGGDRFAEAVRKKMANEPLWFKPKDSGATLDRLADLVAQVPGDLEDKSAVSATVSDLQAPSPEFRATARSQETIEQTAVSSATKHGGGAFGQTVQEQLRDPNSPWFVPNDVDKSLGQAAKLVESVPEKDQTAAAKTVSDLTNWGSAINGAVVDSARADLNRFTRPLDIGCAYQVLSWQQSRLLFGKSVADEFIGIQFTVRNINAKEEFIVHNAMLSVDTDIHGAIGQYFEGNDKLSVEAYNNAGESLTRHGLIGNSITAASAMLSVLQPIVNVDKFSDAVAAFTGGVVPGFKTIAPDHQKEQLLLIANNGFSATNNFKTVVPKSGSATFYTWFPVKPFREGWWVQECAQSIVSVNPTRIDPENPPPPPPPAPQLGVDLVRARYACKDSDAREWRTQSYREWSSTSDQLFRDLARAVVAGIHVLENSKNKALITDLKCPKDAQGQLDLSKPTANGTIVCDVTGENLDKVTKLRLENAGNLVDPNRIDGTMSDVSADNGTAKVAFNVSDLKKATGDSYNVFAVAKDTTETATGQKVYLDQSAKANSNSNPKLTKIDSPLDLGKPPLKVTLTGMGLNNLKQLCLSRGSSTKPIAVSVPSDATATQVTLDLTSAGLTKGDWRIYFETCGTMGDSSDSGKVLKVTGTQKKQGAN